MDLTGFAGIFIASKKHKSLKRVKKQKTTSQSFYFLSVLSIFEAKTTNSYTIKLEQDQGGIQKGYFKPEFDDSTWGKMDVPGCWDQTKEHQGENGWGWYRTTFKMPGGMFMSYKDGSHKFLIVGKGVAQSATIWLNGQKIGEPKGWQTKYKYDVGAYLNFGKENIVTILVNGTKSHSQGLRFYFHILRDDMLNERRLLEKKEYASILWTSMVTGSSGITLWHWDNVLRLFMPELLTELNAVSPIVMPAARHFKAKTAMLLPFLHFRGLPRLETYFDYLAYYGAMTFLQTPVDVLSEKQFSKITPKRYPFVLVPYAKRVYQKTYDALANYVNDGGFAVVTMDSLKQDFDRYSELPIDNFTGVKVAGKIITQETILFKGQKLALMKTKDEPSYGVNIVPIGDTEVIAEFGNGAPAVTLKKQGKGTVCFIAGRLTSQAAHILIGQLLEQRQITPDLKFMTENKDEFPYVQGRYFGTPEKFVLYFHNWGGQRHKLSVKIPREKLLSGNYQIRNIRGVKAEKRLISSDELAEGFDVTSNSMDPVVFLVEATKKAPMEIARVSPLREKILKHIAKLNAASDFDSECPKVLFMDDVKNPGTYSVGRKNYPLVAEFMEKNGCSTAVLPYTQYTPENLKKFKILFFGEDFSNAYKRVLKYKDGEFIKNILNYVKDGGSLIVVSSSAHPNSRHLLHSYLGKELGYAVSRKFSRNPQACGYGDPLQLKLNDFMQHPLTANIKQLQMFVCPVFHLQQNSPMKAIALTGANDLNNPSKPVVIAGQFGKGRVIACTDLMWVQPFRLEAEDNAQFLMNMVNWALGNELTLYSKSQLSEYIFINSDIMEIIERQEALYE